MIELKRVQELVGPCPICKKFPTWLNDIPTAAFCWGAENNEHPECKCVLPADGEEPKWEHPPVVRDPEGEETDLLLLGPGMWIEKGPILVHVYESNAEGVVVDMYAAKAFRTGEGEALASTYLFYDEVREVEEEEDDELQ